ncbi:hypothetical protein [Desulfatibacillum aliphaticivorans]|uniref:hypothetical protein n=1 Tax=Desulfatibacillum aliphaticivorans TaxID=218208 RepID=UPI000489E5A1|nr:hypothetical protein [Desulfatibacillum aliphaticivorans]
MPHPNHPVKMRLFRRLRYLGIGNYQLAALLSIYVALRDVSMPFRTCPINLYTDSLYALSVLQYRCDWRKNQKYVDAVWKLRCQFPKLQVHRVKKRRPPTLYQVATELAVAAVLTRGTTQTYT